MLRMLEAQAPAKQTATDTINTLSSRLSSATLLEDRRAAILGLRSFAKEYPASVASGGLRGLISSLTKDADDVDTTKIVLETLLMLFNPNEDSPEASDDITLWLADEFTTRQDNITILLDLLETPDFYPRLYALQLLSAISSARPERTQECILSAPLGTTRLVATLDDPRDAVRNAGLVILTDLTTSSVELQKLVAFENAFERIFRLVEADGSLEQGGIVVQDCLSLLANLLRGNPSNQSLFREEGRARNLSQLLPGGPKAKKSKTQEEDDDWVSPQKDKNIWGLLAVIRMFLGKGNVGTKANQDAFQKHGLLQQILNLAFERTAEIFIRAEALQTCADMIRGNSRLQEGFAQLQVANVTGQESQTNGDAKTNGDAHVYVIDGLLDLALSVPSVQMFDARSAAVECIQAYFYNHQPIRHHFLRRAIDGHVSGQDETANVLSTLLTGTAAPSSDPYRIWFAAVIVFHLIYEDAEAKGLLMAVSEGDAASGEEVVTCIQSLTGNLLASLQTISDERISVAYLQILCGWLFDDARAVNDFLSEGSSVQSLVQWVTKASPQQSLLRGLCAILLGIIYEFSTKDSPIPRRTLQPVLVTGLGRERYNDAITQLRQHPLVRDFEVLSQRGGSAAGLLPDVYFDAVFVDFLKDNFNRIRRAIDRDPGIEILQTQEGVDRDLLDSIRTQLQEKEQALHKLQSEMLTMERQLNQEQAEKKKIQETSASDFNRIKNINEALQRNHEADLQKRDAANRTAIENLREQHRRELQNMQNELQRRQQDASNQIASVQRQQEGRVSALEIRLKELEQANGRIGEELASAKRTIDGLQDTIGQQKLQIAELNISNTDLSQALEQSKKETGSLQGQLREKQESSVKAQEALGKATAEAQQLRESVNKNNKELEVLRKTVSDKEVALVEKESARSAAQTELDDLLMVLGELEDKRSRDKKRLKALGEEISDDEDAEDDEDEDEDEGEEAPEEE